MPTKLSRAEVIVLLRKAETDSSPVELVCSGPSEQALHLIGFLSFDDEDGYVHVQVPSAVGALFSIRDCEYEYTDPREARPEDRPRAERQFDFILDFTTGEWQYLIRVWKRPGIR
jgi:hypothetical protein